MKPTSDSCQHAPVTAPITPFEVPPVKHARSAGVVASPAASPEATAEPAPPRLLTRLREALRLRHYAIRTEQAYADWARRYILS